MPIKPVDLSELEESHSDGVTKGFTVKEYGPVIKAAFFKMQFGLTGCPLERPPGAEGILMLIIHIIIH